MSNTSQEELSHACDSGWDYVIAEAERQIREAEERISKLRLSIGSFQDFKQRGEPWPGTVKSPDQSGSQPSGG